MTELIAVWSTPQVKWIVWLILIDYVLGLVGAILKKEFRLGKIAKVMGRPVLNYLFGYGVLVLVAQATGLPFLINLGFVIVALALVGSILENLGKFGISVPVWLKRE
jgi:phage-related holin